MTERPRVPVIPVLAGLVFVAGVLALGVMAERLTGDDLALPERLPGGYFAMDVPEGPFGEGERAEVSAARQRDLVESAGGRLADDLGADAAVRRYGVDQSGGVLTLAVVDAVAGPFSPAVPDPDPSLTGNARGPAEMVGHGDVLCHVTWGSAVAEGSEPPDSSPKRVACQLGDDGLTYWLWGSRLTSADAAGILAAAADQAGQLQ